LAIASRLTTFSIGWPSSSFLIGSSCFLPDSVRGISATWKMSSGTKRGDSEVLMALLMRAHRVVERHAGAQHHEQRHVAVAAQVLEVDHHRVEHLGQASTALYISLVPMRRPWRLMVASLRP
jgi:hypothetical protein